MDVSLGSLQLARVRVPAILSGDDEGEGRREGPVREIQLSGGESGGGNFSFCWSCSHFPAKLKALALEQTSIAKVTEKSGIIQTGIPNCSKGYPTTGIYKQYCTFYMKDGISHSVDSVYFMSRQDTYFILALKSQ